MPKMTTAVCGDELIGIDEALQRRDAARATGQDDPDLACPECCLPVRGHKAGGHQGAHFEHHDRNGQCSCSHRAPE